jgi:cytochrome c oxidase subunit I+III
MAIQHMSLIVWTYLTVGRDDHFRLYPLLLATLLLEMEPLFGTLFFDPHMGGSSLLWQHLFWFFGHPGSLHHFLARHRRHLDDHPLRSRRRIVAYPLIVAAILITGFVSFGLWTHHMFTAGLPDLPMLFFHSRKFHDRPGVRRADIRLDRHLVGKPAGIQCPDALHPGFFFVFVNGGLTGVMVATMPFDWQVHDTNFVVAHFHHVLIGGAVFPFLAGLYYWLPKSPGGCSAKSGAASGSGSSSSDST